MEELYIGFYNKKTNQAIQSFKFISEIDLPSMDFTIFKENMNSVNSISDLLFILRGRISVLTQESYELQGKNNLDIEITNLDKNFVNNTKRIKELNDALYIYGNLYSKIFKYISDEIYDNDDNEDEIEIGCKIVQ